MTRFSPSKRTPASRASICCDVVTELRQARYCASGTAYRSSAPDIARAAASPSGIVSGTRSKSAVVIEPISTLMQHVSGPERLQLQRLVGFDHDVHRAAQELGRAPQPVRIRRGLDEIHDDDDVGAQVARDVDRNVADQPAVRQDLVVHDDRREGAWNRHARAHRRGQIALIEHDHAAGHHVGRDGAIGNRQLVEIRFEPRARDIDTQQIFDVAGIDQAARES